MENCCWLCLTLEADNNFDLYQLNQVDGELDFETIRNIQYCPNCSKRLNNNNVRPPLIESEPCSLCKKYAVEKGDTLYYRDYRSRGIHFMDIDDIRFCPQCGKELKEDNA